MTISRRLLFAMLPGTTAVAAGALDKRLSVGDPDLLVPQRPFPSSAHLRAQYIPQMPAEAEYIVRQALLRLGVIVPGQAPSREEMNFSLRVLWDLIISLKGRGIADRRGLILNLALDLGPTFDSRLPDELINDAAIAAYCPAPTSS